jgi:hypothetical protein
MSPPAVHPLHAVAPPAADAAIASTEEIIAELRAGRMVILVDEEDRENEGDLVLAADFVTPEAINFMARFGRGLICLTLTEQRCRQLNLQPMVKVNGTAHGTNFTVSIEAAEGVTTGISAADRARTVQVAVAPGARLTLRLYNKGWVDPALRDRLAVTVDGTPVRIWSEPRREVAEAIAFHAVARRGWMRIGLHCAQAMTDAEAGHPGGDARRKVFNLWRYSYEVH